MPVTACEFESHPAHSKNRYSRNWIPVFVFIDIVLYLQLKNGIKEMSQKEKLLKRIMKLPKDFTFEELIKLFSALGFELSSKGKTSGSRVKFHNQEKEMQYLAHRPHPSSIIKEKALKDIVDFIIENKLSL